MMKVLVSGIAEFNLVEWCQISSPAIVSVLNEVDVWEVSDIQAFFPSSPSSNPKWLESLPGYSIETSKSSESWYVNFNYPEVREVQGQNDSSLQSLGWTDWFTSDTIQTLPFPLHPGTFTSNPAHTCGPSLFYYSLSNDDERLEIYLEGDFELQQISEFVYANSFSEALNGPGFRDRENHLLLPVSSDSLISMAWREGDVNYSYGQSRRWFGCENCSRAHASDSGIGREDIVLALTEGHESELFQKLKLALADLPVLDNDTLRSDFCEAISDFPDLLDLEDEQETASELIEAAQQRFM